MNRLVIFDMDGVLVDSEVISCAVVAECLGEAGFAIDAATVCERYLGVSAQSMIGDVEQKLGRALPSGFREYLRERTLLAYEGRLEAVAGMGDVLDGLEARRCVASSSHPERIRRSLELCGLLASLEPHLFSSTMVKNGKPAPDLFLYAAGCMQVEPQHCLVIEDSVAGVTAGRAAGMRVIGFTGGSHVEHERHAPLLLAAGAHHVVDNTAELSRLLEGNDQ